MSLSFPVDVSTWESYLAAGVSQLRLGFLVMGRALNSRSRATRSGGWTQIHMSLGSTLIDPAEARICIYIHI